ncbi:hypothetical protein CDIK_2177, partial [Cucumispora dikerogammari]
MFKSYIDVFTSLVYKNYSNVKNTLGRVPDSSIVEMRHLIKDAKLYHLETKELGILEYVDVDSSTNVRFCDFPLSFPKTEICIVEAPSVPFILIPLFEIEDTNGQLINLSFFLDELRYNGIYEIENIEHNDFSFSFNNMLNWSDGIINSFKFSGKELIDPKPKSFNFLVFINPLSNTAMLYIGVFLDAMYFDSGTSLRKFYNKYILEKKAEHEDHIKKRSQDFGVENIVFEIDLNIQKLVEGIFYCEIDELNKKKYSFKLRLNKKIDMLNNSLKVKLKGKSDIFGLSFNIDKQVDNISQDIRVILIP